MECCVLSTVALINEYEEEEEEEEEEKDIINSSCQ